MDDSNVTNVNGRTLKYEVTIEVTGSQIRAWHEEYDQGRNRPSDYPDDIGRRIADVLASEDTWQAVTVENIRF